MVSWVYSIDFMGISPVFLLVADQNFLLTMVEMPRFQQIQMPSIRQHVFVQSGDGSKDIKTQVLLVIFHIFHISGK